MYVSCLLFAGQFFFSYFHGQSRSKIIVFLLYSICNLKQSEKNINYGFKFKTGFGYESKRKSTFKNQLCIKLGIQPTRPPYIACEHQLILNKIAENKIKIKVRLFFLFTENLLKVVFKEYQLWSFKFGDTRLNRILPKTELCIVSKDFFDIV